MKEFKEYLEQTSKQSKKEYGIITTSDGYKELSKPSHRYKGEEVHLLTAPSQNYSSKEEADRAAEELSSQLSEIQKFKYKIKYVSVKKSELKPL